jgi:hypothetical protein
MARSLDIYSSQITASLNGIAQVVGATGFGQPELISAMAACSALSGASIAYPVDVCQALTAIGSSLKSGS